MHFTKFCNHGARRLRLLFIVLMSLAIDVQAATESAGPPPDGVITSIGSDTMVYLVSFWAIEFKQSNPGIEFRLEQAGSGTGPPALLRGEATIAPMSRRMKDREIAEFEARFGYRPTGIRVALDTLAVYVNRQNPLPGLTLAQVDAIFSSTRRCGQPAAITHWEQLGLGGEWAGREISLFGRNHLSGTRAFFAEHALCKGEFRDSLQTKTTSTELVSAVSWRGSAIGYSGAGYARPGVRALPLARSAGEPYVEANEETARRDQYPLTRFLYLYVNKPPHRPLASRERQFLRFVLSPRGQEIVANDGFVPLSPEMTRTELAKLD